MSSACELVWNNTCELILGNFEKRLWVNLRELFSWTDYKSKLDQQCKIKNVCVFLTPTKSMSETKPG